MKNKIALIVYVISCLFCVVSNTIDFRNGMLWSKVAIIPAIAIYYLLKSNFKINILLSGVLLSCYLGDIYILISPNDHTTVEILSFLTAYLLLVFYLLPNFLKIKWKYSENGNLLVITSAALAILAYSILALKFDKIVTGLPVLIFYAITLSSLLLMSIIEYFRSNSKASMHLVVACILFYFSDSFYIITKFYLAFSILDFAQLVAQVLSYYFLVHFFIRNEKTD